MENKLNYIKSNISYIKYIIILFSFWVSLNTGSKYIKLDFLKELNFNYILNFLRAILPYLFLLYYFFYENKKNNFLKNTDFVFKLFFLYGLFQISGLIYSFQNLYENYWVVCLFSLLIFFKLVQERKDERLLNLIFLTNIFAISILFIFFVFITFKENIFSENLLYHSNAFMLNLQGEQIPRSGGLSRMGLILFIFLNSLYLKKTFNVKINSIIIVLMLLIASIIFLFQSRSSILCFILFYFGANILYDFKNITSRLKYSIFFILIPILIFISYPNIKNLLIDKYNKSEKVTKGQNIINLNKIEIKLRIDLININENNKGFLSKIEKFSNNRFNAWNYLLQIFFKQDLNQSMRDKIKSYNFGDVNVEKKIFNNIISLNYNNNKKNLFSGYGPQTDRHWMQIKNNDKSESKIVLGPFGAHASNGYIYSLICSGILGLITFIAINIIIFFKVIKIIILHKKINFNSKPFLTTSIFCILFLQMRILFENSFSVFGVDLLFLLSSYIIINNEYKKIIN